MPDNLGGFDQILQAGWYLLELINEVLDLSMIEAGKISISPEPISLTELLADCEAMIEPQAHKRAVRVSFPALHSPWWVKGDRTRVKQVFINLLSNAIKYNRVGGTVEVSCSTPTPGRTRISFIDTGEGLTPEKLAQLFQPFNRLGQESGSTEGTGIGLVVSKRLAELMEGQIGAESTVGVGSEFWIELKATSEPQYAYSPGERDEAVPVLKVPGMAQRTVLCVEDNPANLMLVERLLARRPDLRLITATDGGSGVALARAARPDLILMDINLPGISGIRALRLLAEDPHTTLIPVIALSANAMPRDIEKGIEAGFFRYLTKPLRVNEFMETLDLALQSATASAAKAATETTR